MATIGKAKMAVNDSSLIGWAPGKWKKRTMWDTSARGHGRRKPRGKHHPNPAALRRKARSLAKRKAA